MARAEPPPDAISFLSDYGLKDEFVGVCHGVIAKRCPAARVIDITHEIPRHDVLTGAIVLRSSLPYLPGGVHLAVVDPGVGTSRRAVALRAAEGRLLVGPDNGLLMPAAESLGGVAEAVDVGDSPERLEPVSSTFHGRDVFAPVAAALAAGAKLCDVGERLEPAGLVALQAPSARLRAGMLTAHVLLCDGFGNVTLDATLAQLRALPAELGDRLAVRCAGRELRARHLRAFAEASEGELLLYEDSHGNLALAVNGGSAAQLLGAGRGDELLVLPARAPPAPVGAHRDLGRPRLHLRRTDSTNDRARGLAAAGAPHGTLVTAAEQTAGRGRQGRRWSAPPGRALLMSLLLRSPPPLLPLMAAVAVCDVAGEGAAIKWPNDIVVAYQPATAASGSPQAPGPLDGGALAKLAGILVEGRPQEGWAVLGIGLNVAVELDLLPAELRPGPGIRDAGAPLPAATLGLQRDAIEPALSLLLEALAHRLAEPAEATLEAWRSRDALRGREIAWSGGAGRAQGVDGAGRLVVSLAEGGQTTLGAGEVHLRGLGGAA